MKIIVAQDYAKMSEIAANTVAEVLQGKKDAVLGLATGTTPIGTYQRLIRLCADGEISFRNVSTVNLDEYVGLDAGHKQSYAYFMRVNLFDKVDVDLANTHIPCGTAENLQKECENYTKLVASMPQDVQILGLGSNGHIAFNEPGTSFDSHTHVVTLAESTVRDNARLFDKEEEVPRRALSMGIADIMQAKRILLLVNGANKAQALKAALTGEISENCPASVLQRHGNVLVVADAEAAKLL